MKLAEGRVLWVEEQDDRTLLHLTLRFHVIAAPKKAETVRAFDRVVYEPVGENFGWFVRKAEGASR